MNNGSERSLINYWVLPRIDYLSPSPKKVLGAFGAPAEPHRYEKSNIKVVPECSRLRPLKKKLRIL